MGVEFTEGVMEHSILIDLLTFMCGYKAGCKCSLTDRFLLILLNWEKKKQKKNGAI